MGGEPGPGILRRLIAGSTGRVEHDLEQVEQVELYLGRLHAGWRTRLHELARAEVYYRVLLARYVEGDSWTTGSSRIMLDTSLFRSPRVSFEAVLSRDAADIDPLSCTLIDSGTSDEGDAGADIAASGVSTSATTKVRIRSSSFGIVSGNRFIAGCNSRRYISAGFAVVSLNR
jgi:hypothetical protein